MKKTILAAIIFPLILGSMVSAWELKTGDRKMNISSYLQIRYSGGPASTDQFSVPRLRTDLWGNLSENVGYFVEYDLVAEPSLIYGWINLETPLTKITVGRLFLPFGLEYMTPPARFDTINPTNTLWNCFAFSRDIGLQLSKKYKKMKYYVAVVNGADNSFSDDNEIKDLVGRFVLMPTDHIAVGVSGYSGKSGTTEAQKSITGAEINANFGPLGVKGEYITGTMSGNNNTGWYLQPLLNFSSILQGLLRYESWDPNTGTAGDSSNTTTVGLNYFFDTGTKLQVNYEIKGEETTQTDNNALLVQMQVNF